LRGPLLLNWSRNTSELDVNRAKQGSHTQVLYRVPLHTC